MREHFVALAADADDPDPEVIELAHKLEDAMMLPFVLFVDAHGQFLEGTSGLVNPQTFSATLRRLTQD